MATRINIDSSALRGLASKLRNTRERLQVGWYEGARYDDGTSVAGIAALNEFGSKTAPARPFMRPAIAEHSQKWANVYGQMAKRWLNDSAQYHDVLTTVGLAAEADVKNAIVSGSHAPLSPITLAIRRLKNDNVPVGKATVGWVAAAIARGETGPGELGQPFSNQDPLRDTGYMLATLTHGVTQ